MKTSNGFSALMALVASAAFADGVPEVDNVVMSQDAATREVTITYRLRSAPGVVTLDIETNACGDVWASIGGEHIQNFSADSAVWKRVEPAETHTIVWHPDLSWPNHKVSLAQGGVRAVVKAWALDNTPDYMVVDLSAAAQPNTQRYYPGAAFVPGGVTENDIYKTSSLLMRKIMAKNVTWTMGSVDEPGRDGMYETSFQATLTNNYYIGVFEFTQGQYALLRQRNSSLKYNSPFTYPGVQQRRPIDSISYCEIMMHTYLDAPHADLDPFVWPNNPSEYCVIHTLRAVSGIDFTLPTDAQWEYAARAGHGEGLWGDGTAITASSKDVNLRGRYRYRDGYADGGETPVVPSADVDGSHGTAVVGSYAPNDWGLYDMNGNVGELCLDFFAYDVSSLKGMLNIDPSDGTKSPCGDASLRARVCRCGAWDKDASKCRPAARAGVDYKTRLPNMGFRVTCTAGLK